MWAVVNSSGRIIRTTVRNYPAEARRALLDGHEGFSAHWSNWLDRGYTVRRVTVTLDPTETESVNNNAHGASGVEEEKLWN